MARSGVRDPLDKYRFIVYIDQFTRAGFTQCGTPAYNIQNKEYPEGGAHLHPKQIVDGVSYAPVTLSRGVTNDTSFIKWAAGFIDLVTNNKLVEDSSLVGQATSIANNPLEFATSAGAAALGIGAKGHTIPSSNKYPFSYRRDVIIEHINRIGQVEVSYVLYNAFPIAYKPASDFDSTSDDSVSMETITLAFEGFDVLYTGIAGAAANIIYGAIS